MSARIAAGRSGGVFSIRNHQPKGNLMTVLRHVDRVQCRVCGFEGPSRTSASCPQCRTAYHDQAPPIVSLYANGQHSVELAVAAVQTEHEIAVVRQVADQAGLYHVSSLTCAQSDLLRGDRPGTAQRGNVLFVTGRGLPLYLLNKEALRDYLSRCV